MDRSAEVKFAIPRISLPFVRPANALGVRADGPQVAVVQEGRKIHFQKIELGRDYRNNGQHKG